MAGGTELSREKSVEEESGFGCTAGGRWLVLHREGNNKCRSRSLCNGFLFSHEAKEPGLVV